MTVLIDLLYVGNCSNLPVARQRLHEAVARSGVEATVREREITNARDAEIHGMRGSPTILVDGRDAAAGEAAASMSCRLYRTETGVDGAPTLEQLVEALGS